MRGRPVPKWRRQLFSSMVVEASQNPSSYTRPGRMLLQNSPGKGTGSLAGLEARILELNSVELRLFIAAADVD